MATHLINLKLSRNWVVLVGCTFWLIKFCLFDSPPQKPPHSQLCLECVNLDDVSVFWLANFYKEFSWEAEVEISLLEKGTDVNLPATRKTISIFLLLLFLRIRGQDSRSILTN